MFNYLKFRYRRQWRRLDRRLRRLREESGSYVDRHLRGKWSQFRMVRRFVVVWTAVVVVGFVGLVVQVRRDNSAAMVGVPIAGGTLAEGELGSVDTLNPILPAADASSDINRLIFSGLTQYNPKRQLVGDLAASWQESTDGRTYTFQLRHNVKWHDGVPFTATDVVFTLAAIQNPDSRSPLADSWQGITAAAKGDYTVIFTLPTPLTSFLGSTTVGILPRHLLESVNPAALRENAFNQHPVGTGPFKIASFAPAARDVSLTANAAYFGGRPKLAGFDFRFYDTARQVLDAYARHEVQAVGQISSDTLVQADRITTLKAVNYSLPEEVNLFFRTDTGTLADQTLRQILVRSLNRDDIIQAAAGPLGIAISQPLLPGQTGYTTAYALAPASPSATQQALQTAGWTLAKGQTIRQKGNAKLSFNLVTLAGGELERAANQIAAAWKPLGINLQVKTASLTELQQSYIKPRQYQMLLYGLNVGADPDVYAYWHSSQIKDPGLNLSEYKDSDADAALESGRVKTDAQVRAGKYHTFLKDWNQDAPAAVLYEPIYRYGIDQAASGMTPGQLVTPSDRFYGVQHWTILTRPASRYHL